LFISIKIIEGLKADVLIKEKPNLFANYRKKGFFRLRCKKKSLPRRLKGTKLKKCIAFFLWDFVVKFNFCKKCFFKMPAFGKLIVFNL